MYRPAEQQVAASVTGQKNERYPKQDNTSGNLMNTVGEEILLSDAFVLLPIRLFDNIYRSKVFCG